MENILFRCFSIDVISFYCFNVFHYCCVNYRKKKKTCAKLSFCLFLNLIGLLHLQRLHEISFATTTQAFRKKVVFYSPAKIHIY